MNGGRRRVHMQGPQRQPRRRMHGGNTLRELWRAPTNLVPLALVPGNGITETTCACVFCCSRTVLSTVSMEP